MTPAVPRGIPIASHLPASERNTQPLKGTAIELSSKWQYLLTWNTHKSPIEAQGPGLQGLVTQAAVREREGVGQEV